MKQEKIINQFVDLPPKAQQQVIDFIKFLKIQHVTLEKEKKSDLLEEPFIGMWRDRDNMRDSAKWVRNVRNSEWVVKDG